MTARELISELQRCGPQSLRVILHYVANRIPDARLRDGQRLNDATDFSAWLRELGDASADDGRNSSDGLLTRVPPPRSRLIDNTCPDCGHIHQDESECGENIGAGRTCRCERRVMA